MQQRTREAERSQARRRRREEKDREAEDKRERLQAESRNRQNADRLQRKGRTCRTCININTARALCLLSCRTRQKNLPPTASQVHWKQNVTHFRRDEGRVKSLKN